MFYELYMYVLFLYVFCMDILIIYHIFNYFVNSILLYYKNNFLRELVGLPLRTRKIAVADSYIKKNI